MPLHKPTEMRKPDHHMEITPTTERGCDSGRRRYRVVCWSCFVVVHEATTGPVERVREHFNAEEGYSRPMTEAEISEAEELPSRLLRARLLASRHHEAAGCKYGGRPYVVHLDEVRSVAFEFGVTDPDILVATLLHDLVEDTSATVAEIRALFGDRVAELVDAVSDPPGWKLREQHLAYPNRADRKQASYPRIRAVPGATVLKLCDRIANVRSCNRTSNKLLSMYRREYPTFRSKLRTEPDKMSTPERDMWHTLDALMADPPETADT